MAEASRLYSWRRRMWTISCFSVHSFYKKVCEVLAYTYHQLYKLNISTLRFFTVYGPNWRPEMALFMFIDHIKQFRYGSSSRDYKFISNTVDGIVWAIDRPYPYEVFNLGKVVGTNLKEFIYLIQMHTGQEAKIKVPTDRSQVMFCTHVLMSERQKISLGFKWQCLLRKASGKQPSVI